MRVTSKKKKPIPQEEEEGKRDFPTSYIEFNEENRQINEGKARKWMDAKINTKEVDISINDRPKLAKIGDYWT